MLPNKPFFGKFCALTNTWRCVLSEFQLQTTLRERWIWLWKKISCPIRQTRFHCDKTFEKVEQEKTEAVKYNYLSRKTQNN